MSKKVYAMKGFMMILLSLSLASATIAQGVEKEGRTTANASQVYLEVGGPGIIYSVNYDGRFGKYENGFGFRAGIGGASVSGDGYFAIPVQVNYLAGAKGQYLEVGAGFTYVSASVSDIFSDTQSNGSLVAGTLCLGFRKQPFGKKGITWRVAFTPFIKDGFIPSGGASIGYRF
ncbi:MAG: hypothetical protein IPP99_22515 [Chitinophagaceae bacterium]|nr:hypothetical protein [Chitinophagaceae bacterium]